MAGPHPALPQKVVLDKDLLLLDANDDVIREDRCAAPVRMLLAGAPTIGPGLSPWHPQQHQTDVWGEEELGGEASSLPCSALMQRRRTMEWVTPGASHGRRHRTSRTQPQRTYFWHKCKCCTTRGCERRPPWWSGCVSCVHSLFVPCPLVGPGCTIYRTQAEISRLDVAVSLPHHTCVSLPLWSEVNKNYFRGNGEVNKKYIFTEWGKTNSISMQGMAALMEVNEK